MTRTTAQGKGGGGQKYPEKSRPAAGGILFEIFFFLDKNQFFCVVNDFQLEWNGWHVIYSNIEKVHSESLKSHFSYSEINKQTKNEKKDAAFRKIV